MNNTTFQRTEVRETAYGNAASPTGPLHLETEREKHGILHDMKEGIKDAVEAITGKDMHEKSVKSHIKESKKLHEKAEDILDDTHKDFKKAEVAQHKADKKALKANQKTEKALNKQAKGQELLAEAGAELIEAGAKMQREAGCDVHQAPYNIHQKGEVRQTTCVDAMGQVAAARAHDTAAVRHVQYGAAR